MSPRDSFWPPCFSCSISMIEITYRRSSSWFYSLMILICLCPIKILSTWHPHSIPNLYTKLSTWFKANKLFLNLKKTNFMLFKPRQKKYHFPMQICINEQRIEQVKETVFLGVVLDEHLSWKPHISQVPRKISKSIGVINRERFFLPKTCLKTLYYCLVYPYLQYKTNLCRLVSLQKRVIRIISKSTFDSHSDPIFKELELLKLSDIRQLELGKLMFSLNHSLLPSKFNNYFSLNKQVHSYATRHANDFHLLSCRTNLRKFSVSFQGPTYYYSIENDIKESNSLHLFKTKLRKKLLYEWLVINLVVNSSLSSHVWYYFYTYCYMYHTCQLSLCN